MADKHRQSYEVIFNQLKQEATQIGLNLNQASIPSDFESGFIAAIPIAFPNSCHRGCHFYFNQAIFHQEQAFGLAIAYSTQTDVRLQTRQLMALAFLPVAIVYLTFATLQDQMNTIPACDHATGNITDRST